MAQPRPAGRSRSALRPQLEHLEDRTLPATGPLSVTSSTVMEQYRPDRILVQFHPSTLPAAAAGTSLGAPLSLVPGLYEVSLDPATSVTDALRSYRLNPDVALAQPDYVVSAERLPNDPFFKSQWPYGTSASSIQATTAWDTTVGNGQTIVAVIDTGIDYNHPDLAANLWRNQGEVAGNGVDDDHNGFIDDIHGYNFVTKNGNPLDDHGHGTHVAGILGAVGNNGVGVTGLAWNVKIMALKFMNASGKGATSDALRALNYAVQMGATISNNSWTSPLADTVLETGIRNAQSAGHIYVAAAGNTGANLDVKKSYPAGFALDNVVAVAALDSSNRLPSWSNWGPNSVKIAAPGSGIYSTLTGNRYGTMSGTSMATPFVAGTLALVRELHPGWSYQQVISQVLSTADPLTTLQGKIANGKLNVAAAVGKNNEPPPPPGPDLVGAKVTALASLIANNQIVGLRATFSEPVQALSFTTADVLSLAGPTGSLSPTSVTPEPGSTTQFDIRFAGATKTGSYSVTLGTDILDVAGNVLNQNGNTVNGEVPADRYVGSTTYTSVTKYEATGLPKNLVDRGIATFPLTISDSLTIGAVRVQINLNHAWMSDLIIKLRSPAGTEVLLANRRGGAGKGYVNTIFDSNAILLLSQGTGTFTNSYRPESTLTVLNGQTTNGTWTLFIEDRAGGASGKLNAWSLTFDQSAGGASVSDRRIGTPVDMMRGLLRTPTSLGSPLQPVTGALPTRTPHAPSPSLTRPLTHRAEVIQRQTEQLLSRGHKAPLIDSLIPLLHELLQKSLTK